MQDHDATMRPGRHRARARLKKLHIIALSGLAVLGFGVASGTASADPTAQDWANIRQCESGGNYSINTGNGYYGAYQFDLGTWRSVGGSGLPSDASPAEQDARALTLWRQRGWSPWACASLVSLSDGTAPPSSPTPPAPRAPSTPYARLSAGTAIAWTDHLYRTVLGHSSGGARSSAAGLLIQGQANKRIVATFVATSGERTRKLVARAYGSCLGRVPDGGGMNAYSAYLKNNSLGAVYVALCGSNEAFNRVHRNGQTWVDATFVGLLGRHASARERAVWANVAAHNGRAAVVKSLIGTSTWKVRQLNSIYQAMLGRTVDNAGVNAYAASMPGRGVFTVVVSVALSSEFAGRA